MNLDKNTAPEFAGCVRPLPLDYLPGHNPHQRQGSATSAMHRGLASRYALSALIAVLLIVMTSVASADSHQGARDPLLEKWALGPGDTGSSGMPILADPEFPNVSAWEINAPIGSTLRYAVPSNAQFSQPWTLTLRLRVVDLNHPPNESIQVEFHSGTSLYGLQFGSGALGETLIRALGTPGTVTIPALRENPTHTEYVRVDIAFGDVGADVFVNGIEVISEIGSADTDPSRVSFGDGSPTTTGRARYAEVFFSFGRPACRDLLDNDGDGLVDFSGGDSDCSQSTDPSESGPTVPCPDGVDFDGDELCDVDEPTSGTDPNDEDSDDDLLRDGFEVRYGFDPLGTDEAGIDADADGLDNLSEQLNGTNPVEPDSDGDGLDDGSEVAGSSDPLDPDTDSDGLSDGAEVVAGSDFDDPDTDGDGLLDGFEVENGFDPLVSGEAGIDSDLDGLDNLSEQALGTRPTDSDSDDDGLSDGSEVAGGSDPLNADSDEDGLLDGFESANGFDLLDPDEDLDGRPDGRSDADADRLRNDAEALLGTGPRIPDTDGDGLLDGFEVGRAEFGPNQQAYRIFYGGANTISPDNFVTSSDIDGDGDADLLAGGFVSAPVWLENVDGGGDFSQANPVDPAPASGPGPSFLQAVFGDFDEDGDPDILSYDVNPSGIYWHKNLDGAGTFGPRTLVTLNIRRDTSLAVADLDGDGDLDALSASWESFLATSRIAWHENEDGAGHFGPPRLIAVSPDAAAPRSILTVDLDGDTDVDVVTVLQPEGKLVWYENLDGNGTFGSRREIASGLSGIRDPATGDLDGDGDADFAAAAFSRDEVVWVENLDGLGQFGPAQILGTDVDGAVDVHVADIDLDGDDDVLALSYNDATVAWYENMDGEGEFSPGRSLVHIVPRPESFLLEDVDGDADLDIVASGGSRVVSEVVWFEHLQADPFDADTDDDGHCDGPPTGSAPECAFGGEDTNGNGVYDVGVETNPLNPDTDADGLCDGGPAGTAVECVLGAEDANSNGIYDIGIETDPLDIDTDRDRLRDGEEITIGTDPIDSDTDDDGMIDGLEILIGTDPFDEDTDDDGLLDGFEHSYRGRLDPLVADDSSVDPDMDGLDHLAEQSLGTHPFDADTDDDGLDDGTENAVGTNPLNPDTDDDGLLDPFELEFGLDPTLSETNADPDFDGLLNLDEQTSGTSPIDPDSDDDGLLDGEEPGILRGFSAAQPISDGERRILSVDLDGDTDFDLISSRFGQLGWQTNTDGLGSFAPWQAIDSDFEPTALAAGDIDGDGHVDLVGAGNADLAQPESQVVWFHNTGVAGIFDAPQVVDTFSTFSEIYVLNVADFDGDGDLDLATFFPESAAGAGEPYGLVWNENLDGEGGFGPRTVVAEAANVPSNGVADFDNDGRIDLVLVGDDFPRVWAIVFGDPATETGFSAPVEITPSNITWPSFQSAIGPVHLADVDADGDIDLVNLGFTQTWYENADGEGRVWRQYGIAAGAFGVGALDSADFNGDGDLDLLFGQNDLLDWKKNLDGKGTFGPPRPIGPLSTPRFSGEPFGAVAVDLNSDAKTDVLVLEKDGALAWYPRTGLDPLDPDGDGDGLCDGNATLVGACPIGGEDTNGNGIYDPGQETDPNRADTDGDGVSDGIEVEFGSDPLDPFSLPDADGDGILDPVDNCLTIANAPPTPLSPQLDADGDGFGNACDADFDQSGAVNGMDFGPFISSFNASGSPTDLNGDGVTNGLDFGRFIALFNMAPGPSSLPCADAKLQLAAGVVPCLEPSAFATDTDGDGVSDGAEIEAGTDPASAVSFPDVDGDLVPDSLDNCLLTSNGPNEAGLNQLDSDQDGYGNACDADFNNDGVANGLDFAPFISSFAAAFGPTDLNGDGLTNGLDYGVFLALFNTPPGPSGLACAGEVPCQAMPIR